MKLPNVFKARLKDTRSLWRAVRLVWASSRVWTAASFVVLIIQGLLPLLALYLLKLMLDAVSAALAAPDKDVAFGQVINIVIIGGFVTLVSSFLTTIGNLITQVQGRLVADYMSDVLHEKSIAIDLEYYENAQYFDTLHRAQQEAAYRPVLIVNNLSRVVQSGISLAGIGALLLSFQPIVMVLLAFAVLPGIVIRLYFSQLSYQLQRKYTADERRSWYFDRLVTGEEYAKEIRIFDLGHMFIERYQAVRKMLRRLRLRYDLQQSSLQLVADTIGTAAVYGSYLFVAYRTVVGSLTLGDLVVFYQAFQRGQSYLQGFLTNLASLYEHRLFVSNLYEFLDLPARVVEPQQPVSLPKPMQQGVYFDNVSFHYPNTTRVALSEISLKIQPGEVIALVGENGSGKTTLVKLLCRLYDPDSGAITLDGVDLREFAVSALRREISVIFQDYAHYNLTAAENIGVGDNHRSADDKAIIAAAQSSDAHDAIMGLPKGYETILGKLFEDGEELSIGQWQKIALARAFLRNSQVIVLDEPTSAMDAKSEYEVFRKFRELLKGRTAILISHRLSTVRMADRIYVLQEGRIIESGTHDELIYRHGTYAQLFETQAEPYR